MTTNQLNRVRDLTSSAQTQLDSLKTGKLNVSATAVYAQSAGAAVSAQFATSATNATSAVFATSAAAATNAVSAQFATSAANATNAVNATNATSAVYADSAGAATSAVFATSASAATNAVSADRATSAIQYVGSVSVGQVDSASVGGRGLVELATTAEYATGTDTARVPSAGVVGHPLSIGQDGYVTLPGGGLMAWGQATGVNNAGAVSFGVTFGSAPRVVAQYIGNAIGDAEEAWGVYNISTTGFNVNYQDLGTTNSSLTFHWIAIGVAP